MNNFFLNILLLNKVHKLKLIDFMFINKIDEQDKID